MQVETWRLSEEDDARELIRVFIKTGIISFSVFGVFATIVFQTCKAAWWNRNMMLNNTINTIRRTLFQPHNTLTDIFWLHYLTYGYAHISSNHIEGCKNFIAPVLSKNLNYSTSMCFSTRTFIVTTTLKQSFSRSSSNLNSKTIRHIAFGFLNDTRLVTVPYDIL